MTIGFDVISDLNLSPEDSFNWEGKATSLYLIIAGNISSDLRTVHQTLLHLSRMYQGVFYTLGSLEYEGVEDIDQRTEDLYRISKTMKNVAILHHHVVVIDGVAIAGANGWYGKTTPEDLIEEITVETQRNEDIIYLKGTVERLQRHLDVKNIILVSSSVPGPELYFGEDPSVLKSQLNLSLILPADTEKKVKYWVYGTYGKVVDTVINNVNYVNNSSFKRKPYWAKRIEV